jgi:hypothetical protein
MGLIGGKRTGQTRHAPISLKPVFAIDVPATAHLNLEGESALQGLKTRMTPPARAW